MGKGVTIDEKTGILAAVLAVSILAGLGQAQTARAEGADVPPADRISPTQIKKNLTVPNGIHVTLKDGNGKVIDSDDAQFQLLDQQGNVVAQWSGTRGYLSASDGYVLDETGCTFRAGDLYDTGDLADEILIYQQGSVRKLDPEDLVFLNFGKQEAYVGYGDRMTGDRAVTVPAGEICSPWVPGTKSCRAWSSIASRWILREKPTIFPSIRERSLSGACLQSRIPAR